MVTMTRMPGDYEGWTFFDASDSSVQCPVCKDFIMLPADLKQLLETADAHEQICWSNHVPRQS